MKRSKRKSRAATGSGKASSPPKPVAPNLARSATRSRRWLFRLTAALFIPLFFLVVLEAVLRIGGYGYNPDYFLPLKIGGESLLVQNEEFSRRFFPPETMRYPGALRMHAVKPSDTIRIFILGESAAMGDPEPAFGPSRYMEVLLRERYPGVDFEVVNVAFTAINSHVILPIARECARHDGDAWIIYMGNNEMVGPFGASTTFGAKAPPLIQVRAALALQRWRLGQLLSDAGRRLHSGSSAYKTWGGMRMFLDNLVGPGDPMREVVRSNFERTLEDILRAGVAGGAAVVLNTVAVNLKDLPPFASLASTNLSPADRTAFDRLFKEARSAVAATNLALATDRFWEATELDPDYAAAHYEWGRALLESGDRDAARDQLQRACDADALAFRTDSHLNEIIRDSALRWSNSGVRLLDAETVLEAQSTNRIVGEETFYEHVHFNFEGAYRLGLAWARELAEALSDRLPAPAAEEWGSPATCDALLGLTDWNRKFVLDSMMHRFQIPPLGDQPGNEERVRRLRERQEAAMARMTPAHAPAAREVYETALAGHPDDHYLHEAYGGFLQATGDLEGAAQAWRRVSELLPHDFLPWFQLGVLMARQERHPEAQGYFRKAIGIRPSVVVAWTELAQSLGATRDWEEALECFEKACHMRPGDPVQWAYRAKTLGELGRTTEAMDCYRQALELNPGYREAHAALGDLLAQAGRFGEALAEYEAALQLNPDDVTVNFNRGVMLLRLGRLGEGAQMFQTALQLDPNHKLAREYLNRLQAASNPDE